MSQLPSTVFIEGPLMKAKGEDMDMQSDVPSVSRLSTLTDSALKKQEALKIPHPKLTKEKSVYDDEDTKNRKE